MESGKRPSGAMELETVYTQHFQSCSDICSQSLETRGYLCTAFYHEEDSWLCTTYMYYPDAADANEMALAHETSPSLVPSKGDFYRILCGNADRGRKLFFVISSWLLQGDFHVFSFAVTPKLRKAIII